MTFIIENSWLFVLVLLSGSLLLIPTLRRAGKKLSLLEATQRMNQGKCLILDVRPKEAFDAGHIKGAKNIALKALSQRLNELNKYKNHATIVVCTSGIQSGRAVPMLEQAGFKHVWSLEEGMRAWEAAGLPILLSSK